MLTCSSIVSFVKSIKGWDNEKVKGVPRLVTYDFLEDSLEDNKVMQHFWAYHPGKPRDIEAILAGRRRVTKKPRAAKLIDGGVAGSSGAVNTSQETARDRAARKTTPESTSKEKVSALGEATAPAKRGKDGKFPGTTPIIDSVAKASPKNNADVRAVQMQMQMQKQKQKQVQLANPDTENIPEVDNRPWELKTKARIFQDKSRFSYHVELTRERDNLKWFLEIFESTSISVPKSYRFRAIQYGSKNQILCKIDRDPVPTSAAALKQFTDTFRARTGYSWDERLLRANMAQPIWRYRAPEKGKPAGSILPKYTPGHPDCVKDLSPIGVVQAAMKPRFSRSVSEAPEQRLKTDKTTQWKGLTEGRCQQQMKRKAPEALDAERPNHFYKIRKMCEAPKAERRAKATKTGPPALSLKAGGSVRKS